MRPPDYTVPIHKHAHFLKTHTNTHIHVRASTRACYIAAAGTDDAPHRTHLMLHAQ